MSDLTKEIIENASSVASDLYKDAVRPVVKPIGEILAFYHEPFVFGCRDGRSG